jgi:hypothetical protein
MSNEITLLGLVAAIFLLGLILHLAYLKGLEKKLRATAGGDFDMRSLKNALQVHQGSNFNTVMLAAWSLFFVALVFLYFLTPSIFPEFNYFKLAQIASDWWGLSGFGVLIIIITLGVAFAIPSLSLPWTYRFYVIPRNVKEILIPIVPALLIISIASSLYLGTIYPTVDFFFWNVGYVALLAAQLLLIFPLFFGIMEELG